MAESLAGGPLVPGQRPAGAKGTKARRLVGRGTLWALGPRLKAWRLEACLEGSVVFGLAARLCYPRILGLGLSSGGLHED